METKYGLLKCRSVRRKHPGEQWSLRETVEARGTKWNFDVEMDSWLHVTMKRCRQRWHGEKFPQYLHLHPSPEEHVPEMRGQGVYTKALKIRAFWSEIGRTPGCPACETPGPGKYHTRECKTYQDAWGREPPSSISGGGETRNCLEIRTHDRWTRVRVQQIPTPIGQKQPL